MRINIPDADGQFDKAPNFNWNDGKLHFNNNWVNNTNKQFGSASGFLPKSFLRIKGISIMPFMLVRTHRTYPPTQHSAYFVHVFLQ